jgi:hypothetical protein
MASRYLLYIAAYKFHWHHCGGLLRQECEIRTQSLLTRNCRSGLNNSSENSEGTLSKISNIILRMRTIQFKRSLSVHWVIRYESKPTNAHKSVSVYYTHCYLSLDFRHEVDDNCALPVITQRVVVISDPRFRTTYRSHLQGSKFDGTDRLSKTSVRNYHYWLRNSPEERSTPTVYLLHVSTSHVAIFREILFVLLLTFDISYIGSKTSVTFRCTCPS